MEIHKIYSLDEKNYEMDPETKTVKFNISHDQEIITLTDIKDIQVTMGISNKDEHLILIRQGNEENFSTCVEIFDSNPELPDLNKLINILMKMIKVET